MRRYFSSEFSLVVTPYCRSPKKERSSCLWLQSRSVLSSFSVVLMSRKVIFYVYSKISIAVFCMQNLICLLAIFADQVFIDRIWPTRDRGEKSQKQLPFVPVKNWLSQLEINILIVQLRNTTLFPVRRRKIELEPTNI